jgi:hypothetical protein
LEEEEEEEEEEEGLALGHPRQALKASDSMYFQASW